MKIKGLTKYDFFIGNGEIKVKNQNGKFIKKSKDEYHEQGKFNLTNDVGKKITVSEIRLSFCLKNNCKISDLGTNRFYGTVDNPMIGRRDGFKRIPESTIPEKLSRIMFLEQSIEMLKYAIVSGDYSNIIKYSCSFKRNSIASVSKVVGCKFSTLEPYWDEAFDLFMSQIMSLRFTSLKPIYNHICTCLKVTYVRKRGIKGNYSINSNAMWEYKLFKINGNEN
ncbi:MAG: hypothetical protein RRY36_07965 [Bacteroidaceae bacterium]